MAEVEEYCGLQLKSVGKLIADQSKAPKPKWISWVIILFKIKKNRNIYIYEHLLSGVFNVHTFSQCHKMIRPENFDQKWSDLNHSHFPTLHKLGKKHPLLSEENVNYFLARFYLVIQKCRRKTSRKTYARGK